MRNYDLLENLGDVQQTRFICLVMSAGNKSVGSTPMNKARIADGKTFTRGIPVWIKVPMELIGRRITN
jgi:hypothetical protein